MTTVVRLVALSVNVCAVAGLLYANHEVRRWPSARLRLWPWLFPVLLMGNIAFVIRHIVMLLS